MKLIGITLDKEEVEFELCDITTTAYCLDDDVLYVKDIGAVVYSSIKPYEEYMAEYLEMMTTDLKGKKALP